MPDEKSKRTRLTDSRRLDALATLVQQRGSVVIHRTCDDGLAADYGAFGFSPTGDIRELCDQIATWATSTAGGTR